MSKFKGNARRPSFFQQVNKAKQIRDNLTMPYEEAIANIDLQRDKVQRLDGKHEVKDFKVLLDALFNDFDENTVDRWFTENKYISDRLRRDIEDSVEKCKNYQKVIKRYERNEKYIKVLRNRFIGVASLVLAGATTLTIASSSIKSNIGEKNQDLNDTTFSEVSEYENLPSTSELAKYIDSEKGTVDYSKLNKEQITKLALDNLKVKIADHYGIPDPENLSIYYNSSQVQPTINGPKFNGSLTEYEVSYTNPETEKKTTIYSNTIESDEKTGTTYNSNKNPNIKLQKSINAISKAQDKNSNKKDSKRALQIVNDFDSNTMEELKNQENEIDER